MTQVWPIRMFHSPGEGTRPQGANDTLLEIVEKGNLFPLDYPGGLELLGVESTMRKDPSRMKPTHTQTSEKQRITESESTI